MNFLSRLIGGGPAESPLEPADSHAGEVEDLRAELALKNEAIDHFAVVHKTLDAVGPVATEAAAAQAVLDTVRYELDWKHATYWSWSAEASAYSLVAQSGVPCDALSPTSSTNIQAGGLLAAPQADREPRLVDSLGALDGGPVAAAARSVSAKCALVVPVAAESGSLGTLLFLVDRPLRPSRSRITALQAVSRVLASTIERMRQVEASRAEASETMAVNSIVEQISAASNEEEAVRFALRRVREAFAWDYGSFWKLDGDAQILRFHSDDGNVAADFRFAAESATYRCGDGIVGRAWSTGQLIVADDLSESTSCARGPAAAAAGLRSGVALPVFVGGEVYGVIDFFVCSGVSLSRSRSLALRSVSNLVGAALTRTSDLERLLRTAHELSAAATQLAATSAQMADVSVRTQAESESASAGAIQVSENVAVVLSGVEEMTASIAEIASSGSEAASVTASAVTRAEKAGRMISELESSSQEIEIVVELITDIAKQTNLLALNATIEAARAGEAGKGFNVVANSVKSLAEQTARATEEISSQVEGMQSHIGSATQMVRDIRNIIGQVDDFATAIAAAVEEQNATACEISRNLSGAAAAVAEIASGIQTVAENATEASQCSHHVEGASHQVSDIAKSIDSLIQASQ